jgi:50S ribosomal subunit-associated GTPase HflX
MGLSLNGERVVIAGLLSVKEDVDARFALLSARVIELGGEVVGRVVQRRGVSRSRRPGGASKLDAPMNRATFMGRGKASELATTCIEQRASVVVFANRLDPHQRGVLEHLTRTRIVLATELR